MCRYFLLSTVNVADKNNAKLITYRGEIMSQHASLRVGGKIRKKRNVMKRFERLDLLRAEGRIPEDKVLGLPKTKAIN